MSPSHSRVHELLAKHVKLTLTDVKKLMLPQKQRKETQM